MATMTKFNAFVEDLAEGVHNLGANALTIALFPASAPPDATKTTLAGIGSQTAYTNLASNPTSRILTVSSSAQSSGTYKLVLADLVLTASGGTVGPFRYLVVYNDTAASDQLIGWFDYLADVTLQNGETFTLDFDPTNGVLQLA